MTSMTTVPPSSKSSPAYLTHTDFFSYRPSFPSPFLFSLQQAVAAGKLTQHGDSFKVVKKKKSAPARAAPAKKAAPRKRAPAKKAAPKKKATTKKAAPKRKPAAKKAAPKKKAPAAKKAAPKKKASKKKSTKKKK